MNFVRWTCSRVCLATVIFLHLTPILGQFTPSAEDLWDVSTGVVVTAHSPLLTRNGGADIRELFGFVRDSSAAPGTLFFQDAEAAGFVHFVEWRTPTAVSLKSLVLNAAHDGVPFDANERGFSRFTLYVKDPETGNFDLKVFEYFPGNPYSSSTEPVNGILATGLANQVLQLCANVPAVVAQEFRAEFVQFGDRTPLARGPRIRELDGFDIPCPVPVEKASLFPQLLAGGGAGSTTLLITNPTNVDADVRIQIFEPGSGALFLSFTSGQEGSDLSLVVPARGTIALTTAVDQPAQLTAGWIRVDSAVNVSTLLVFSILGETDLITEASVLQSPLLQGAHFPVDTRGAADTGVAFSNPSDEGVEVWLTLYDDGGLQLAEKLVQLGPSEQTADFVTELFSDIDDVDEMLGAVSVTIHDGKKVPIVALRQTGLVLTVIPVSEGAILQP